MYSNNISIITVADMYVSYDTTCSQHTFRRVRFQIPLTWYKDTTSLARRQIWYCSRAYLLPPRRSSCFFFLSAATQYSRLVLTTLLISSSCLAYHVYAIVLKYRCPLPSVRPLGQLSYPPGYARIIVFLCGFISQGSTCMTRLV